MKILKLFMPFLAPVIIGIVIVVLYYSLSSNSTTSKTIDYNHPEILYTIDRRTTLCFADIGESYTNVPCNPEVLKLIK
jgi:hypothetical protein